MGPLVSSDQVGSEPLFAAGAHDSDPLTFLAGPALFFDRLNHALARGRRNGQMVGVLVINTAESGSRDADEPTDLSLTVAEDRLRIVVRASDTLTRLSNSLMGVVLEGVGGRSEALAGASRVVAAFDDAIPGEGGRAIRIEACVGVAVSAHLESAEELVAQAVTAAERALAQGPGSLELFDSSRESVAAEIQLGHRFGRDIAAAPAAEVRALLDGRSAMTVVMQPILDLRTGVIAGFEALARFPGSQRNPEAWFALARRCGLGIELEALAVSKAFASPDRVPGTYLAVNLSPSALVSAEVWSVLPERLDDIVIEITEHELITQHGALEAAMRGLRDRGARFAIDDAGSGYSGLQQLTWLQPELIKLDRALIENVDSDRVKAALVNALVRFAESIGATVCAEGIERIEELSQVAELGITYAQGYFIARPDAGWPTPSAGSVEACHLSVEEALGSSTQFESQATDRRMAAIASASAGVTDLDGAIELLELISREMNAHHVCLSSIIDDRTAVKTLVANESFDGGRVFPLATHPLTARVLDSGDMVQVRTSDPIGAHAELAWMIPEGYQGLLMAPIGPRSEPTALLEICCRNERPWNRAEIYRTRVICQLLEPAVHRLLSAQVRESQVGG